MSQEDRIRWDNRYGDKNPATLSAAFPLPLFAAYADRFPSQGRAMDIACGRGEVAVWFALRGMSVVGLDVSSTAIDLARELAANKGVTGRCRFKVVDLDNGLPEAAPVDLLICHNFRNPSLYNGIQARLAPGGLLAIVTLSEVGASPGRFRAKTRELETAFSQLENICAGEEDGRAWLLAKKC